MHHDANGGYIDVHAWQFTPEVLTETMDLLKRLDLCPLSLVRAYDTPFDRNEFVAVFRRRSDLPVAISPHLAAEVAEIAREDAAQDRRPDAPTAAAPSRPDRWSWRLVHPAGHCPRLAAAPDAAPRPDLAGRAIACWRAAGGADEPVTAWTAMLTGGDAATIAATLASLGRLPIGNEMLGGARQHERARDPVFAEQLARLTHDRLVSLAEAVGALPVELPEAGRWDRNARLDPTELFAAVEQALAADLAPPDAIGGHLGLGVRDGLVLHPRMLDAIHAAWSLREGGAGRVIETGGGAGLTAFYARRLGLDLRIADTLPARALQSALLGEQATVPLDQLPTADTLFNADGLTGWPRDEAVALIRRAADAGIIRFVSINHEATLPGHTPVAGLMDEAGGWRRASRHRHWLRAGYVEELWEKR